MAKIKLSEGGFKPISEGEHIFKIVKVDYDEDFGKVEIEMVIASGQKHIERFHLVKEDGEINEGALNAFSYFAKTALNNYNLDEIDHKDLEGCYIKAVVEHTKLKSKKDPSKDVTFVNIKEYSAASGFEKNEANAAVETSGINLDDLLG